MNVEPYSYSLFTTVLGMLVVFLSLTALSVVMVVLKAIFSGEGKRAEGRATGKRPAAKGPGGRLKGNQDLQFQLREQSLAWLPAAVAAYLAEEQESDCPSADPWNAVVNQYDPWIAAGRSTKRGI